MLISFDVFFFSVTDDEWSLESTQAIVELTQYRTQQAQITSYTENGLPEIRLYSFLSPNVSRFDAINSMHKNTKLNPLFPQKLNHFFTFGIFSEHCMHQ